MNNKSIDLLDLAESSDPRDFLKRYLNQVYRSKGKINLSEFSRKLGFSSRSFVSEYLSGKKYLSKESLSRIKEILRFNRSISRYFEVLVLIDQPNLRQKNMSIELLKVSFDQIKNQLISESNQLNVKSSDSDKIIRKLSLFRIFASLGTLDRGASVLEIHKRTNIDIKKIIENLYFLIEVNAVKKESDRYYANKRHIEFLNNSSTEAMAELYKEFCIEFQKTALKTLSDKTNTFMFSAFSVQKNLLPSFKKEVQTKVFEIIEKYQDDSGDSVHEIMVCSK